MIMVTFKRFYPMPRPTCLMPIETAPVSTCLAGVFTDVGAAIGLMSESIARSFQ